MLDSTSTYHLLALTITLVVEISGAALWAVLAKQPLARTITSGLVINLVVHTLFWYSQPIFAKPWPHALYIAETLVVVGEGALYAHFLALGGFKPWLLSLALNSASLIIGLIFWPWLV